MCFPIRLSLVAFLAAPLAAQNHVWVVDDNGGAGVDFIDIQSGVNAAAAGDVLLVKPGTYDGFTIIGKSLTVQADLPGVVQLHEGAPGANDVVEVFALDPGQVVTLRGFEIQAVDHRGFHLLDCQGTVWIEECEVVRPAWTVDGANAEGMWMENCADVILVRTTLRGGEGHHWNATGGPGTGLRGSYSQLHAFECLVEGGNGGTWYPLYMIGWPYAGAHGLHLDNSFGFFSDCLVRGGDGGTYYHPDLGICVYHGNGGHGAYLVQNTLVRDVASIAYGGSGITWGCPPATHGEPVLTSGNSSNERIWGEPVGCATNTGIREGGTLLVDGHGPARAPIWLAIGTDPLGIHAPQFNGSFLVASPLVEFTSGTTDATGGIRWSFPLPPDFVIGTDSLRFYGQTAAYDPTHGFYLGEGSAVLILDSAF